MALYRYKAVNVTGDVAAGELEAANESEIVDRLRDQGLMPMQVEASVGDRAQPGATSVGPCRSASSTVAGPRRRWGGRGRSSSDAAASS